MFLLESPPAGDSNEYTQYTIFNIKNKITLNYPKPAVVVALLFYVHGKHLRSCRDGQLT